MSQNFTFSFVFPYFSLKVKTIISTWILTSFVFPDFLLRSKNKFLLENWIVTYPKHWNSRRIEWTKRPIHHTERVLHHKLPTFGRQKPTLLVTENNRKNSNWDRFVVPFDSACSLRICPNSDCKLEGLVNVVDVIVFAKIHWLWNHFWTDLKSDRWPFFLSKRKIRMKDVKVKKVRIKVSEIQYWKSIHTGAKPNFFYPEIP